MGLFKKKAASAAGPAPTEEPTPGVDWSDIESIRAEWPRNMLNPAADLQGFDQARVLYERDDYATMMRCATLFATALAHSLHGPGILKGNDFPETIHKTLYCSMCPPPDGRTFADSAQKAARLALTLMRENGWQPPSYGGTTSVFESMIKDPGNFMLLTESIAPAGEPWRGDLKAFFAVPPTSLVEALPTEQSHAEAAMDTMANTLRQAEDGDGGSGLYADGLALQMSGDLEGALAKFAEAARLGSVDAMSDAAGVAGELGRAEERDFWYEAAAKAGHPVALFNMGVLACGRGEMSAGMQWFQQAAEAGNAEGYAALTQIAHDTGDAAAEEYWSRLGAEAGQLFCMSRYGLLLSRGADGDVPTMRRARDILEQAADRGDLDSASLAINLNHQLGDAPRAQRYVTLVVQSGDAESIERLRRYGYL